MDAVPLWTVDPSDEPAHREADVEMGAGIGEEVDHADDAGHVGWDVEQEGKDREKRPNQQLFQPEMSRSGDQRHRTCAVMERMHGPQEGDDVLKPMLPIPI